MMVAATPAEASRECKICGNFALVVKSWKQKQKKHKQEAAPKLQTHISGRRRTEAQAAEPSCSWRRSESTQ